MTDIGVYDCFKEFCGALSGSGAFLVVQDPAGKPNPMTIGWATLGVVWGEPILTVLVRPSRHTHGLIEEAGRFSVNVPLQGLEGALELCGSRSGRDCDKIAESGLRVEPGRVQGVSVLPDCDLFFECETVHKTRVIEKDLDTKVLQRYYASGDFHTIYNGRVLHSYQR
ncbi:MAG: flavin reductase family protein [Elusimicrobiota bacterium]